MKPYILTALLLLVPGLTAAEQSKIPLDTFKEVQWETHKDQTGAFTLRYPYHWRINPEGTGEGKFEAQDDLRLPNLRIANQVCADQCSAIRFAKGAAMMLSRDANIVSEEAVTFNGQPAHKVIVDWTFPIGDGITLRSHIVAVVRGDKTYIMSASDAKTTSEFDATLLEALNSITFN